MTQLLERINGRRLKGHNANGKSKERLALAGADLTRSDVIKLLAAIPREKGGVNYGRLAGVNFSGLDLSKLNFSRLNLHRCSFTNCNLTDCDFQEASCWHADFSRADLTGAYLYDMEATGCNFDGATLTRTDVSGADLSESTFVGASFKDPISGETDFLHASFTNATLDGVCFEDCKLGKNEWGGVKMKDVSFHGARTFNSVADPTARPDPLPPGVEWSPPKPLPAAAPAVSPPPTPRPGCVWSAFDASGFCGYLVTDAKDRGVLIAFIPCTFERWAHGHEVAGKIAANYDAIYDEPAAQDLRVYCQLDSDFPTPAVFYNYRLKSGTWPTEPGEGIACVPLCRYRLAKMVASYVRLLGLDDEDWKLHPLPAIAGHGDGKSSNSEVEEYFTKAVDIGAIEMPL
jgi:uncharacterized protein YjbI with pentapeptide repeats